MQYKNIKEKKDLLLMFLYLCELQTMFTFQSSWLSLLNKLTL